MTASEGRTLIGHVAEIRRYPVKSMQGERLERTGLGPEGLESDRQFAVLDAETGRVASAKNPRKWAGLLYLRAELREGVLVVTTQDGTEFQSNHDDLDAVLSRLLGRRVTLRGTPLASAAIEIHWPDLPGMANAGTESVEGLPAGGFFDLAPVHLLTTATLRRFRELAPNCDFDPRRFRPNLVIETLPELTDFVEDSWVGRTISIGESTLRVTAPCSRCVMTTLPQPGLPTDSQVLRAAVSHNAAAVGCYATVTRPAELWVRAPVWLS